MPLSAILAMSENRVIGYKNQLPWHLPADLKHFKALTMGHPIIMGRKTFLSIGRALPGRKNIIITRDTQFKAPGCEIFHSIESVLHHLDDSEEAFVIGGAEIINAFLPYVSRLYLTLIHATILGDAFFPEIDFSKWKEISRIDHQADNQNAYAFSFVTLQV